jgi:glycosyltransferase involved in cell wall biosynthesis
VIPQFSLCIPAYRNPATLEASLGTVLKQAGDDYEIVVSDDQGPPGSL